LGNALSGTQCLDAVNPGMIEGTNRHRVPPWVNGLGKTDFTGEFLPISSSFVKVSGR
jgi:hypothetical protein